MATETVETTNKIYKSAQLLNFGCANRKVLLEKEITTVPPSIRILLTSPSNEELTSTVALLEHILSKRDILSDSQLALAERKVEYSTLTRSADELCELASNLIAPVL